MPKYDYKEIDELTSMDDDWPHDPAVPELPPIPDAVNSIDGLDYDEAIQFIRDHPEKVDAVWQQNQMIQMNAGHGGVPLMIFQNEPFFGQDRFDMFYWRLRQSGLTKRKEPRAPFTTKPLRWPDS